MNYYTCTLYYIENESAQTLTYSISLIYAYLTHRFHFGFEWINLPDSLTIWHVYGNDATHNQSFSVTQTRHTHTHLLRNALYVSKNGLFCFASNLLAFFLFFLCMSYVEINAHIWFITLIAVFHHTEIDSSNVFLWHCNSNTSHVVAAIGKQSLSFFGVLSTN